MKRLGGAKAQAQWWLGLGLALACGYLGWAILVKPSPLPEPRLPEYSCPGQIDTYNARGVKISYRPEGACEGVSSRHAIKVADVYDSLDGKLQALRLPPLPRGVEIRIYRAKRPGYELLGRPGGPRAIALRTSSADDSVQAVMYAYRALAELGLQEAAPGLDERGRQALAGALAAISAPDEVDHLIYLGLDGAALRELARLGRSKNPFALAELLERHCRSACEWARVAS